MGTVGTAMNIWNNSVGRTHQNQELRKAEMFAQRSTTKASTHPTLDGATGELGRFRRWWSDHPMLSVVVMFVAPVVALLLFMALY